MRWLLGVALALVVAAPASADVLDHRAILGANKLDQPQWYEENIPFLETPDSKLDEVYYYRWSTYKRALRYTVAGTGFISTEYDVPVGYGQAPYTGLVDAAGYHISDGRWLRNPDYAGEYLDFWLRGGGTNGQRGFSEWLAGAAWQRYLVTGDATRLKENEQQLIQLWNAWNSNLTGSLYFQSPLSDATEYTETSMKTSDWFGGGAGFRPTINTYMYEAARVISRVATMNGDTANASLFASRAASLKQQVQDQLWDPQRQFFMQIYNNASGNGALRGTRTTWREAMGFTPWMFNLPDPQYSVAWKSLLDPDRFAAPYGPLTLERWHDFPAGEFSLTAPAARSYPIRMKAAGTLTVNGVSQAASGTVTVPLNAGANTIRSDVDLQANPYFDFDAIPASQQRDDANCCHWNGPSWPYATSMILTGLANQLHDYPAQNVVTAADYRRLLSQFATLQHKGGKPYVAEAANGDTGDWIYDGFNFSENYNHSSFNDLVLTGLLGIRPQADDTLVLDPLVDPTWNYFAVEDVPYHGHLLTIVWDRDGSRYGRGAGLSVWRDSALVYNAPTLAKATIDVGGRRIPAAPPRMNNIAANPLTADQIWLRRTISQPYPQAFASFTNPVSNGPHCHSGQGCQPTTFDSPARATNGWVRYDEIPDDRWTNKGSVNATDYLGVNFGYVRRIDNVHLFTYDDGATVRTPQALEVQYLDGATWRTVARATTIAANAETTVAFAAVSTSQVRVVFTPQTGKFVGVTELESWWPQDPPVTITNVNSGLPLAVDNTTYGAAVRQVATGDTWDLVPAEDGYVKIINRRSGLVLGISGASRTLGATALQWGDNLTPDHLWSVLDQGDGTVKLRNKNSGLLLGIQGASTAPGTIALQWEDNGTSDHLWRLKVADRAVASEDSRVGGTVPATLSLTLGAAPSFGAFLAGVDREYTASTTATVISSAGDAALTVSDPGHLANGAYTLAEPLRVALSKSTWTAPVSNDPVSITFKQHIGASDPLRTGAYAKALMFTLTTTTP
jgi:hypothetical protein